MEKQRKQRILTGGIDERAARSERRDPPSNKITATTGTKRTELCNCTIEAPYLVKAMEGQQYWQQ